MKKIIALAAFTLLLILLPFITGNIETRDLDDAARKTAPGKFIKLTDGMVHYEIVGPEKGEPLVLIHGNAAPMFSWDNNIKFFTDAGFKVLRYDLYGFGFSDRPETEYTRELYDRQLIELLDKLGFISPLNVAGTSQGGSIAVYFTAKHPEKVKRLALLSPFINILPMKALLALLRAPLIGDYLAAVALDKNNLNYPEKVFADKNNISGVFIKKYHEQLSFRGFKQARLANFRGDALKDFTEEYKSVADVKIPVLITWGTADKVIMADSVKNIRNALPAAGFHEIEGGGHLVHYESPDKVNGVLTDFFRK
jgi:pimeloyl-ACP methyl ester carboxylesterase